MLSFCLIAHNHISWSPRRKPFVPTISEPASIAPTAPLTMCLRQWWRTRWRTMLPHASSQRLSSISTSVHRQQVCVLPPSTKRLAGYPHHHGSTSHSCFYPPDSRNHTLWVLFQYRSHLRGCSKVVQKKKTKILRTTISSNNSNLAVLQMPFWLYFKLLSLINIGWPAITA